MPVSSFDESVFRALAETVPDPVAVRSDGVFSYVNPAMARYLDYDHPHDVARLTPEEFVARHVRPPALLPLDEGEDSSGELELATCRGRLVVAEYRISRLSLERTRGVALFLRDVTECRRTSQALHRSEENFRTLIERAPVAMCVSSGDRMLYANRALLDYLGYEEESGMLGPTLAELSDDLIHPSDRERTRAAFARLFADLRRADRADSERVVRIDDVRLRTKSDGSVRYCDIHGVVVLHDGAPALVTSLHDQTARHTTADRMRLADRMSSLGTLAAGVAHEINNPLTYVIGNVEFVAGLLETGSSTSTVGSALREVRLGLDRIRKTVRALKAFSRADEETVGAVDVIPVLESCVSMVQNHLRHKGKLSRRYSAVSPVCGNESRIAQVFLNLLVNAAEALDESTEASNEVTVIVEESPGQVRVEVRDNGHGIPAADLAKVFDPFFTTKPVGVGTGLGLFVCHEIVKAVGGDIRVESQVGVGTRISVWLPVAQQREAPRAEPHFTASPRRASVLIIDDEPEVLALLGRILESEHDVRAVSSGAEALRLLSSGEHFDVILCDLMMPGLTGAETYSRIAQEYPNSARKVLFMTGGAVTESTAKFIERAPRPCLEKPFEAQELLSFVRLHAQ